MDLSLYINYEEYEFVRELIGKRLGGKELLDEGVMRDLRMLDISICSITRRDLELLGERDHVKGLNSLMGIQYEHGFIVYVGELLDDFMKDYGYSDSFVEIMEWSSLRGI